MRALNMGVVGLGRVLDFHLPVIEQSPERFRITAVCDTSERRRAEVAERLHANEFVTYADMLAESSIDVIVVATPPTFHADHTIQALKSGKHVIVEKPMALHAKDALLMVEAAEENGRLLVVHQNQRYSGFVHYPAIKDALDRDLIGRPYQYTVQLMSGWGGYKGSPDYVPHWECKKEHGGGTLFSWGPHLVDILLHAHHSEPQAVFAALNSHGWDFDGDSNATLVITFSDNATAQVEISYVSPHNFTMFYVRGENGSINYDSDRNCLSIKSGTVKSGFHEEEITPEPPPRDIIYTNLYQAIEHGEPLLIKPRDIHLVTATLETARISAAENRVVEVSEILAVPA